jgi:hypothetical protein
MTIEDAINDLTAKSKSISSGAIFKVVKVSEEEARLSVYVPGEHVEPIREATREQAVKLIVEGLDVQIFVYDKAENPPPD